jgi:hypothetical protein
VSRSFSSTAASWSAGPRIFTRTDNNISL